MNISFDSCLEKTNKSDFYLLLSSRMLAKIKHGFVWLILIIGMSLPFFWVEANSTIPPNFEDHFAKPLLEWKGNGGDVNEKFFNISCVDRNKSIRDNVECLLFPSGNGGFLRGILRYVGYLLVFISIVKAAAKLLLSGKKPDDLKAALTSFMMILIGSALYFGVVWILSTLFNISGVKTTAGVSKELVSGTGILFFILSLLKWWAFFYAIIMIVMTGFQMMNPSSAEEEGGKKLIWNLKGIIAALVGLKVVDFLYFIASQGNFSVQAGSFIITIAKFLAYISGTVMVLMIIYAGYQLILDGGKWENFKKAKNTLINILLAVVSLFFFLFVIYQIFSEFN